MSLWNKLAIELRDMIIFNVDDLPDLLSFALTCHSACSLIIPGHLEFRHLCFMPEMSTVWKQLSQSRFLGNVKCVQLMPTFSDRKLQLPNSIMSSQHWTQLRQFEPGIDMNHVAMALKGMRNLQELGSHDGLFCPAIPELFKVLPLLPPRHSLEHLHIDILASFLPNIFPTLQPIYVTSLYLGIREGETIAPESSTEFIATFLRPCHQLCDLFLTTEGSDLLKFLLPCLESIVLPHLTRFSLVFFGPRTRGSSSLPKIFSRFLKRHPKLINLFLFLLDPDLLQHVDHDICPRLNSLTYHNCTDMPILTPSMAHQLVFLEVDSDHSSFLNFKEMISLRFLIAHYLPKPNTNDLWEFLEAVPETLECLGLEADHELSPSIKEHEALYRLQKLTHLSNWFGLDLDEFDCQERLEKLIPHLPNLTFVEAHDIVVQLERNDQEGYELIELSEDTPHASKRWGQQYLGGGYIIPAKNVAGLEF